MATEVGESGSEEFLQDHSLALASVWVRVAVWVFGSCGRTVW